MKRPLALACLAALSASSAALASAPAPPPSFTVSASDTTMPASGNLSIPLTFTSVNGFAGDVTASCTPPVPRSGVLEPVCGGGPVVPITLAANGTATGYVNLEAYVYFPPNTGSIPFSEKPGRAARWAMAGVLTLGLASRRKRLPKSRHLILAFGMLIGLAGMSGCGGGPETLTPGVYTYTVNASEYGNSSISATTTVKLTVPAGIDVRAGAVPF